MCLRLNKDEERNRRVREWRAVSQMREPAGYLGEIVRRMKYRAAVRCDGGVLARLDVAGRSENRTEAQNKAKSR